MTTQSRYFLGLTLPSDLADYIDTWRQSYHPYGLKTVEPHITIIAPFCLLDREEELIKKVTQRLKRIKEFNLTIQNFDFFHYQTYTVFANVLPSEELAHIYNQLQQTIGPYRADQSIPAHHSPYRPHITLAHRLRQPNFQELWLQLQNQSLHQTITVNHLALFRKEPNQPYHIIRQLALDN